MRLPALIGAALLALAAGATFAWGEAAVERGGARTEAPKQPPAKLPTPAEMRQLQAEADSACRCSRQPGKAPRDPACWAGFERSLARYEHSEGATACLDESVAFVCFPAFGDSDFAEHCVFRERIYGACSEDEALRKHAEARARGDKGCGG